MALVSWNLLSTGGRVTCRNLLTPSNVCQGGVVCMMWGRGSLSSFTYWLNAHPLIWCHNWFFFFIHLFLFFSCHPHCMLPTVGQFIIICLFSSCETTMIHSLCCFNRMVFVPHNRHCWNITGKKKMGEVNCVGWGERRGGRGLLAWNNTVGSMSN